MANIKIPQLGSAQIINDTNYLIVDDGLSTMKATTKQIKEYATNDVKAEIAENWTENVNYTVGNVVNWNGTIYRCIQNNLSSESLTPANATYWEDKTIGDMIYSLNSNLTNKITAPNHSNFEIYFPSSWNSVYFSCQDEPISVAANGDTGIHIAYNIPGITSDERPIVLATPFSTSGVWAYCTVCISSLDYDSCIINVHNLENRPISIRLGIFIMYKGV